MDKVSRQRRQVLFYLGLGVVGAGVTAALGVGTKGNNSTATALPTPAATKAETASAALAAAGKQLPDFQGIQQWLNSDPLAIADLKGNVVLIQFWTFACINCQRTLPYIVKWNSKYAAQGLRVVGIHTPEFAFEREPNNIKRALKQHQITYPVPVDNEYKTWNAYSNQYWPHLFLADRHGFMRYDHIGEGAYDTTEQTIQQLLKET
ncbi:thioredoxin family protein [Pleurocapsa sp. FMAR1]|uniref:thioredoxin family protein n=1 Tax=Pleurocapsa sp. FMAR1 TaxID=3040204 RepID=UPI0029C971D4|nr:thioredoxin family protein [Pleurocapsa sp. FMAR1]